MGATLSSNNHNACEANRFEQSQKIEARKRQRTNPENSRLIPNLPDEISIQILARLPRISHHKAKLVSRTWRSTLASKDLYDVRKELKKTEQWLYILTKLSDESLTWYAVDPSSNTWQRLPPMPNSGPGEGNNIWASSAIRVANAVKGWFVRKTPFGPIPFGGSAIAALDGSLYVIGGCSRGPSLKSAWRYSPILNSWTEIEPMSTGRAFCHAGVLDDKIYVAGGVDRGFSPLRSAEVFDPKSGKWCEIPKMPFSRARALPDLLKPVATGMTPYKGKLYVTQSLHCWPFFVNVGGEAYDPGSNSWVEMPAGMGVGWPEGSKPSAVVNGELYALEPGEHLDGARVKVYDEKADAWRAIGGDVVVREFADVESPCLLVGINDELHVITKDSDRSIKVVRGERRDNGGGPCAVPRLAGDSNLGGSLREFYETETVRLLPWEYVWRVAAVRRGVGTGEELVSCQVLEV